jgi:hypothetical protein
LFSIIPFLEDLSTIDSLACLGSIQDSSGDEIVRKLCDDAVTAFGSKNIYTDR